MKHNIPFESILSRKSASLPALALLSFAAVRFSKPALAVMKPKYPLLVGTFALLLTAHAQAATIVFTDDFSGDTAGNAPSNFGVISTDLTGGGSTGTRTGSVLVEDVSGDKVARHIMSAERTGGTGTFARIASQSVQITNSPVTTGLNFAVTTQFTINSFAGSANSDTITISLIALAGNGDWSANSSNRYQLNYNLVGSATGNSPRLLLQETVGTGNTTHSTSSGTLAPQTGVLYTLFFTGTYADPGDPLSSLLLEGSLTDGTDTLTVSFTDTSPRTTGDFFGIRSGVSKSSTNGTVAFEADFTNFSVIPEPSSTLLGAFAALALLRRKR